MHWRALERGGYKWRIREATATTGDIAVKLVLVDNVVYVNWMYAFGDAGGEYKLNKIQNTKIFLSQKFKSL